MYVFQEPIVILIIHALHVLRENLVYHAGREIVVSPEKMQRANDNEVRRVRDNVLKLALFCRVDAFVFYTLPLLVVLLYHFRVQNTVVHRCHLLVELWHPKVFKRRRDILFVVLVLE